MVTPVRGRREDPREYVTEHAFRVAPHLLGRPLAGPWRRALALLVDLGAVAVLANAPGLIFGFAVAFVMLRASVRPAAGGVIRRSVRWATRGATAVIVFAVAVSMWDRVANLGGEGEEAGRGGAAAMGAAGIEIAGLEGLIASARMLEVAQSADEAEARDALQRLVSELREMGVGDAELIRMLGAVRETGTDRPWIGSAVDSTLAGLRRAADAEARQDSILALGGEEALREYVQAVSAGDSIRARDLRRQLPTLLAADSLEDLRVELDRSEDRMEALEEAVVAAGDERGVLASLRSLADDMGLGFGWSGLYFTAFVVLWRGRTPGKRLLGVRVVQLDGEPIGWWSAFQRFAGYAAGLATGLLGFLQIFWDRNRQGIQDQIARTVVVRDTPPVPTAESDDPEGGMMNSRTPVDDSTEAPAS